jgi:activator-of-BECN1-regulated-autophagy protein 1
MSPPSPSSVRWHYDSRGFLNKDVLEETHPSPNRQLPSKEEMQRRWALRRTVEEESQQHRRVHTNKNFMGNSICKILKQRSVHGNGKSKQVTRKIRLFGEHTSVTTYQSAFLSHLGGADELVEGQRPISSSAVSTISISFSSCGSTMASTHGDHTVKITDCYSGHLLQTLVGHPRTPWTCKYHPIKEDIVASGCLGHQVRLWNWKTNTCLAMIRLEFAIISLSFHPTGKVLAIANGTRLHFWGLDKLDEWTGTSSSPATSANERGMLTEVEQRHMLRCVHFPPAGNTVIVGGVNPADNNGPNNRPRRGGISGGGMSFYLRLWDFNLEATLDRNANARDTNTPAGMRRRAISNVSILGILSVDV